MDSILNSVKKMLGIEPEYTHFDSDIVLYINAVLLSLTQIGIGPDTGFTITDVNDKWVALLGDRKDMEAVKTYIFMKVRLMFDPPSSSFVLEAIQRQIAEFEWRINIQIENQAIIGGV